MTKRAVDSFGLPLGDEPPIGEFAQNWRERGEERQQAEIAARVIRANGDQLPVKVSDISATGLRLEGAEALTIGENVLLLLPNSSVVELNIRWVLGPHAGARIVD